MRWFVAILCTLWQISTATGHGVQMALQGRLITAPTSGTVWVAGSRVCIDWDAAAVQAGASQVTLTLHRNNVYLLHLGKDVPNTLSYCTTLPAGVPPSAQYNVQLDPSVNGLVYRSDGFTIVDENHVEFRSPEQNSSVTLGSSTLHVDFTVGPLANRNVSISLYRLVENASPGAPACSLSLPTACVYRWAWLLQNSVADGRTELDFGISQDIVPEQPLAVVVSPADQASPAVLHVSNATQLQAYLSPTFHVATAPVMAAVPSHVHTDHSVGVEWMLQGYRTVDLLVVPYDAGCWSSSAVTSEVQMNTPNTGRLDWTVPYASVWRPANASYRLCVRGVQQTFDTLYAGLPNSTASAPFTVTVDPFVSFQSPTAGLTWYSFGTFAVVLSVSPTEGSLELSVNCTAFDDHLTFTVLLSNVSLGGAGNGSMHVAWDAATANITSGHCMFHADTLRNGVAQRVSSAVVTIAAAITHPPVGQTVRWGRGDPHDLEWHLQWSSVALFLVAQQPALLPSSALPVHLVEVQGSNNGRSSWTLSMYKDLAIANYTLHVCGWDNTTHNASSLLPAFQRDDLVCVTSGNVELVLETTPRMTFPPPAPHPALLYRTWVVSFHWVLPTMLLGSQVQVQLYLRDHLFAVLEKAIANSGRYDVFLSPSFELGHYTLRVVDLSYASKWSSLVAPHTLNHSVTAQYPGTVVSSSFVLADNTGTGTGAPIGTGTGAGTGPANFPPPRPQSRLVVMFLSSLLWVGLLAVWYRRRRHAREMQREEAALRMTLSRLAFSSWMSPVVAFGDSLGLGQPTPYIPTELTPDQASEMDFAHITDCAICLEPLTSQPKDLPPSSSSNAGGSSASTDSEPLELDNHIVAVDVAAQQKTVPSSLVEVKDNGASGSNDDGAALIILAPCAHRFHRRCALRWLTERHRCPLCNVEVPNAIPEDTPGSPTPTRSARVPSSSRVSDATLVAANVRTAEYASLGAVSGASAGALDQGHSRPARSSSLLERTPHAPLSSRRSGRRNGSRHSRGSRTSGASGLGDEALRALRRHRRRRRRRRSSITPTGTASSASGAMTELEVLPGRATP